MSMYMLVYCSIFTESASFFIPWFITCLLLVSGLDLWFPTYAIHTLLFIWVLSHAKVGRILLQTPPLSVTLVYLGQNIVFLFLSLYSYVPHWFFNCQFVFLVFLTFLFYLFLSLLSPLCLPMISIYLFI